MDDPEFFIKKLDELILAYEKNWETVDPSKIQ